VIEARAERCEYLQFEGLRAWPEVMHAVFTRRGGYSAAPYDGLNLSISTGDDLGVVRRNRQVVSRTLGLPLVSAFPTHGAAVAILDQQMAAEARCEGPEWPVRLQEQMRRIHADAMLTEVAGVALFWAYGDCAPVLLYDARLRLVGLVHAGWRGTAQAVTARTLAAMQERFGSQLDDIYAAVGPAIGGCCYEITDAVRQSFATEPLAQEAAVFVERAAPETREDIRLYLDVGASNERQLLLAGLAPDHVETSGYCTGCESDLFYSNRRGPRHGGRFGVAIGLRGSAA
jgi:purine-nucleoside/S-methyl-5'-thioadenosine phosphorylase / adenosine deaminase